MYRRNSYYTEKQTNKTLQINLTPFYIFVCTVRKRRRK